MDILTGPTSVRVRRCIKPSLLLRTSVRLEDLEKKLRNHPDLQRYLEEKLSENAAEYEITTVLQSIDPQLSETAATSSQMCTTRAEMTTEKSTTVLQSIDPQLSETTATSPQMWTTHAEITTEKSTLDDIKTWNKSSNNYYYKLFCNPVNYTTAKAKCKELGADLASVGLRNATVRSEILKIVKSGGKDMPTWVGLDDIKQEGKFVWADDIISTRENTDWNAKQPDNYGRGEDCGEFNFNQNWKLNDAPCSELQYYICEKWDQ
uniref:CD209 antigen-like protein E n=1 Tax=Styela clava TaxID=7725 RepID=UPI001939CBFB|nr:CD209 antigen-like protein E [Styela clava]